MPCGWSRARAHRCHPHTTDFVPLHLARATCTPPPTPAHPRPSRPSPATRPVPSPRHVTTRLVATGALTNVALLLAVYPEVVPMVEVVIMGGCLGIGNTGPVVEFNIQTDPEAAHVVFTAGAPLTMVPLEVGGCGVWGMGCRV